jgi:hypothetical protein
MPWNKWGSSVGIEGRVVKSMMMGNLTHFFCGGNPLFKVSMQIKLQVN